MKTIGIIGGAGPAAGAELVRLIVESCQRRGSKADADFPRLILWSEPFADMLDCPKRDAVSAHLRLAIDQLQALKVDAIGVACNTLHAFLPKLTPRNLVCLIAAGARQTSLQGYRSPIILSSNTSREQGVHSSLAIGPKWPTAKNQELLEGVISAVLAGDLSIDQWRLLVQIARATGSDSNDSVVMGCTELSLLRSRWCEGSMVDAWAVIDPLQALAEELVCSIWN